MKKEKSPILVVMCIFFLLIFIVLPPVFRKLIPREVKIVQKKSTKSISILMCNKVDVVDKYNASIKMRYVNNKPISNIITYSPIKENTEESNNEETNNQSTNDTTPTETNSQEEALSNEESNTKLSASQEFNLLNSVPNINLTSNNGTNTFEIDTKLNKENPENEVLSKYFNNDINIEKDYYESIGYSCNIVKS